MEKNNDENKIILLFICKINIEIITDQILKFYSFV